MGYCVKWLGANGAFKGLIPPQGSVLKWSGNLTGPGIELPSQEKFPTTRKKNSWSSTEPRWTFFLPPLQAVTQSNVYWMMGRWILVKTFGEGEQELRTDSHVKTQLFLSFNSHFPRLSTYRSRRHCPFPLPKWWFSGEKGETEGWFPASPGTSQGFAGVSEFQADRPVQVPWQEQPSTQLCWALSGDLLWNSPLSSTSWSGDGFSLPRPRGLDSLFPTPAPGAVGGRDGFC